MLGSYTLMRQRRYGPLKRKRRRVRKKPKRMIWETPSAFKRL